MRARSSRAPRMKPCGAETPSTSDMMSLAKLIGAALLLQGTADALHAGTTGACVQVFVRPLP